jgi:hypothetical protein
LLLVSEKKRNPPAGELAQQFGEFALVADPHRSRDFGRAFPAEGLLRVFAFDSGKGIRVGASLGQSLQTIRFLSDRDECVLQAVASRVAKGEPAVLDIPFGLWTKCGGVFAEYFLRNWTARQEPMAFLLYDSPPVLPRGAPVFIHSEKNLRIVASFVGSEFVVGYKPSADTNERIAERERVWRAYRELTIEPPTKQDFDTFWDAQNGVRALFLMENLVELSAPIPFRKYGRALEWGYPMGVGYRYLSFSQCVLMLRAAELPPTSQDAFLAGLLRVQAPRQVHVQAWKSTEVGPS